MARPTLPRRKRKDPEGRMALVEHLKELRNRFLVAAVAIVVRPCRAGSSTTR